MSYGTCGVERAASAIHAAFGTPSFWSEYEAAIEGKAVPEPPRAAPRTLEWLIAKHMQSSAWSTLSPATRKQRENIYRGVSKQAGDIPLAAITRAKIIEGRERRKDTPAQANVFIKACARPFRWALDVELAGEDPTRDVRFLPVKSDGFHTWADDEIERFEARWPIGKRERLAFDLLLYTGLRRGDAVRLGRQHVRDGWFRISTEKTATIVEAPILPPLARSIGAGPTGDLTFIVGERGRPMTKESFTNWFRTVCEATGVPGSAHGLRKAGATRAAEAGATVAQLKAMFGWTHDAMPSLYTKTANRARLAGDAMSLIEGKPKQGASIPSPIHKVREQTDITSTISTANLAGGALAGTVLYVFQCPSLITLAQ